MPTVLVAAAAHLHELTQREEFKDVLAFADTDVLRAFDAIARKRATMVVMDSAFAATSRGSALITRIKADPLLSDCEVRILAHDDARSSGDDVRSSAHLPPQADPVASTPPSTTHAAGGAAFEMIDGVELLVDGASATLVDLSTSGAQVVSTSSLKPHQRVRLTLPGSPPIQVNGEIAWAMFEMPAGGPRYRAGVAFSKPDADRLAGFIENNKRQAT